MEPSLTWLVSYSLNGEHSAALGFTNPEDEHPELVMDILWRSEVINGVSARTDEDLAAFILKVLGAGDHFFAASVDGAIALLELRSEGHG